MSHCATCEGLSKRFNLVSLQEYQNIVRQLIAITHRKTLLLTLADCPLEAMLGTPLPGDLVRHHFCCSTCKRTFQLSADTYHGNARWTPDRPADAEAANSVSPESS